MNGAQAMVKCLENEGVEMVFGYPGVAICPFYDSLLDTDIKSVLIRTEQNAAHAASGLARVTGKVGVCFATSGPGATNLTTGIAVAHARGVLLYTAEKCGIPLHEYTPSQVKMAVVGYGKAEKRQVMDMTRRLLHLKAVPRPDDAADALALALCHARSATSRLPLQDSRVKETI